MKRLWTLAAAVAFFAVAYIFAVYNVDGHVLAIGSTPTMGMGSHLGTAVANNSTSEAIHGTMVVPEYNIQTPIPTPIIPTYNIVLLGGDQTVARAARGERLDGYQHTDVFVIVHVEMSDPPRATAILVPRNLWVQDDGVDGFNGWTMVLYGWAGASGVRQYVGHVFGLPVDAVFYVRMDRFPELIDKYLGGLSIEVANGLTVHMTGAEVLAYLRDNDNNWGCLEYDCDGRVFRVLDAMKTKAASLSFFNFNMTDLILMTWGQVTSDVGIQQVYGMARDASVFVSHGGTIHYVRLWTPEIQRADTPLDVRGMVPTRPLYEWMNELLTGGN